jgi:signal transduction histidine kinase
MRLQQLKRLAGAMEALSSCVEVDALLPVFLSRARDLFRLEAAWSWLLVDGDQLHLHHAEGVPSTVALQLQRIAMPATGEQAIARRLRRLGYRSALVAPLRLRTRISGMVAVGSRSPRRLRRIDSHMWGLLVRYAGSLLDLLQRQSPLVSAAELPPGGIRRSCGEQGEHLHQLNALIAAITHDLNNTMAAINGRVELLLNRPHDQRTMQHLGATLRAITEANHLIRHIQALVNGRHRQGAVMIDLNQLLRDSLQIARSTWFQEFRDRPVPIELVAELRPMPALPGRAPDLRIAFLCLLRHAMDTLHPGGGLIMRTWTDDEDPSQTVFISISDAIGQPLEMDQAPIADPDEGIGFLLESAQTAESRRVLQFVQTTVYDLGGRIAVHRNAAGGSTITLRFSVGGAASSGR